MDKYLTNFTPMLFVKRSLYIKYFGHLKIKHIGIFTGLIALQLLGSKITLATYFLLVIWTLRGPRQCIEALTLSWLIAHLTPALFSVETIPASIRWLILFSACGRLCLDIALKRKKPARTIVFFAFFCTYCAGLSLITSYAPSVSLLKIGIFFIGVFTILEAFSSCKNPASYWQSWFGCLFITLVLCSFPLINHPLGFFRNGRGFQGILNHPQVYGVILAIFLSYYLFYFLFDRKKQPLLIYITLLLGLISLFYTQARTGIIALFGALLMSMFYGSLFIPIWRIRLKKILVHPATFFSAGLLLTCLIFRWDIIINETYSFIHKGRDDRTIESSFQNSRGDLISKSMQNFKEHPVVGNGFGIASDQPIFHIKRDSILGLPIGASIEKGFLPAAILEEIGLPGFLLWIFSLYQLSKSILNTGRLPQLCLFFACLFVNIGESIFFSFGGIGLFMWLMIGFVRNDNL